MTMKKIAAKIPESSRMIASEKLADIVLNSPNAERMPSDLARAILHYWQTNQLHSEVGLQRLLEAAMIIDPEKTVFVMKELDLSKLILLLRETT